MEPLKKSVVGAIYLLNNKDSMFSLYSKDSLGSLTFILLYTAHRVESECSFYMLLKQYLKTDTAHHAHTVLCESIFPLGAAPPIGQSLGPVPVPGLGKLKKRIAQNDIG